VRAPAFDIAYVDTWRISIPEPVTSFAVIINTSGAPLDLSTFHVSALSDDHPTGAAMVEADASLAIGMPGQAAGALTTQAELLLVTSGLVPEARTETQMSFMSLAMANFPSGTYDVEIEASVSLDGVELLLPFTVHMVPDPVVTSTPSPPGASVRSDSEVRRTAVGDEGPLRA
jgi:hypothetical protein